jgi:ATP-dependent RNA helicase DDX46/PRP5
MIDVLTTSNGKITNLQRVTYVVLDEADRMLDMGFEPQISRMLPNIRPDRQSIMCSATFPRQIESMAKKALSSPIEIVVGNRGQACKNVEQTVEVREENTKFHRLLEILGEWSGRGSVLIFVDKHIEGDNLFKDLFQAGYKVLLLHGGQDQTDREFTIADFKNGIRNIMVATSIAARGLDIKSVVLVINYNCPNHCEDYVHRVGRTGRAGNKGMAITFITPEECQYSGEIIKALKLSGKEIPEDLEELDGSYRQKVSKGEMEKYKPNGYSGIGYKFNQAENRRLKQVRKQLSVSYGFEMENSDSEDDLEVKDAKLKQQEEEKPREQLIAERIKDPNVKQAAMDAAINAAKIAIVNGSDLEGIKKAAEMAINKVIEEYKPTVSAVIYIF